MSEEISHKYGPLPWGQIDARSQLAHIDPTCTWGKAASSYILPFNEGQTKVSSELCPSCVYSPDSDSPAAAFHPARSILYALLTLLQDLSRIKDTDTLPVVAEKVSALMGAKYKINDIKDVISSTSVVSLFKNINSALNLELGLAFASLRGLCTLEDAEFSVIANLSLTTDLLSYDSLWKTEGSDANMKQLASPDHFRDVTEAWAAEFEKPRPTRDSRIGVMVATHQHSMPSVTLDMLDGIDVLERLPEESITDQLRRSHEAYVEKVMSGADARAVSRLKEMQAKSSDTYVSYFRYYNFHLVRQRPLLAAVLAHSWEGIGTEGLLFKVNDLLSEVLFEGLGIPSCPAPTEGADLQKVVTTLESLYQGEEIRVNHLEVAVAVES